MILLYKYTLNLVCSARKGYAGNEEALVRFSHKWYYKNDFSPVMGGAYLCFPVSSTYTTFLVYMYIYITAQSKATYFQTVHVLMALK